MGRFKANLVVSGDERIERLLETVGEKPAARAMRAGLMHGGRLLSREIKKRAPVETKALKRSLGVKGMRTRDGRILVLVGARAGAKYSAVGPDGRTRKPVHYAHLADRDSGFMSAVFNGKADAAATATKQRLLERLKAEAEKLARKGKR